VPLGMFDEPPPEDAAYLSGSRVPEWMASGLMQMGDSQRALDLLRETTNWVRSLW